MNTELLQGTLAATRERAIDRAAEIIVDGGIVAFPTETVYGLGADAFNPEAIAGVFRAKRRPADNPLIVHVDGLEGFLACAVLNRRAEMLIKHAMPGPLTLVLESRDEVPVIARAGLPTVALRMPDHALALQLIAAAGPLVAPSANLSGRPSPTTAMHVLDDLSGRIDAVLDGGPCRVGIESTVLDLTGQAPTILRPGRMTAEEISAILGEEVVEPATWAPEGSDVAESAPRAPGMKYRHYAPRVPVRLLISESPPDVAALDPTIIILTTERHLDRFAGSDVRPLREETLYAEFRAAEEEHVAAILIYAMPGELSGGLMNRIMKAVEPDS